MVVVPLQKRKEHTMNERHEQTLPVRINILIFCLALPATWGLLWTASHLSIGWMLLAAWGFALLNNTPFSLMHEAVHGVFSSNKRVNEVFGVLCAPTLPTSFTVQRIAHIGHHKRNRTDAELFDYYLPGRQTKRHRDLLLYGGNLLGLYWFFIPLNVLVYLCVPWLYRWPRFIEGPARWLSFDPFVRDIIASRQQLRIWFECLWAVLYQAILFWLLDLNWQGWLLCYWAFALHWSSLQYVDHAGSVRDVVNGAWNLKVLGLSRWLALNYHYHLTHHQHPQVPWTQLPNHVDPTRQQPTFWSIYFDLWRRGTRPAPPMGQ
jgi:fatty acid desaturase